MNQPWNVWKMCQKWLLKVLPLLSQKNHNKSSILLEGNACEIDDDVARPSVHIHTFRTQLIRRSWFLYRLLSLSQPWLDLRPAKILAGKYRCNIVCRTGGLDRSNFQKSCFLCYVQEPVFLLLNKGIINSEVANRCWETPYAKINSQSHNNWCHTHIVG